MNLNSASGHLTEDQRAAIDAARYDLRATFRIPQFWDEGEGGEGGEGEGEGEGSSGANGGEGNEPEGTIKDPDKKRLSDEAAKHRNAAREAQRERDEALAKIREFEDKDKDELEKATRDLTEAKSTLEQVQSENTSLRAEVATLKAAGKFKFRDVSDAMDLAIKKAGIKGDEDDLEKVITDALEAIAKDKPYLLEDGNEVEEEEGQPSGRSTNGHRKDKTKLDEEALRSKFPALRR